MRVTCTCVFSCISWCCDSVDSLKFSPSNSHQGTDGLFFSLSWLKRVMHVKEPKVLVLSRRSPLGLVREATAAVGRWMLSSVKELLLFTGRCFRSAASQPKPPRVFCRKIYHFLFFHPLKRRRSSAAAALECFT